MALGEDTQIDTHANTQTKAISRNQVHSLWPRMPGLKRRIGIESEKYANKLELKKYGNKLKMELSDHRTKE